MPFSHLGLHPSLTRALKELGFTRPTPIQSDAIPPALAGRDVLACAATGSGKTAAFLLPILQKLMGLPRGTTRALVLTPTRELAAQILEDLNTFAVHTPISAAAVFGGVGMGPQEQAFRRGADVIIATPGRLLDHFRQPYAKLSGLEFLVLDEADRMLDMGFLPDIKRVLRHVPQARQTLFFSATMPAPIVALTRELLRDPATINLARQAAPATGITQAIYPVSQDLKGALLVALLQRKVMTQALVFTRTKHRADRLTAYLEKQGVKAARIHGNRSQAQRTLALAGFKSGEFPVLVATDIAARGIDVTELGHVVNFDVPVAAEDYIHRVGRTGRAEATGEAFTFVSKDEEGEWAQIEKVVGKRLPRVQLPDFDYTARPEVRLEIPLAERIAAIRKRKAEERARAQAKAAERAARLPGSVRGSSTGPVTRPGGGRGPAAPRPQGQGQGGGQGGDDSRGQGAGTPRHAPAMHARPHGSPRPGGSGGGRPGGGRPGSGRPGGPGRGPGGGGPRRGR
ncbi:DEAD/DEAH box helicase [Luteitalea sp.]|uniref:DEAD/DEAH box helicase n=1 Tax=Luteitalea sp. TaxID=2004800 RepID=UPI0037CBFA8B